MIKRIVVYVLAVCIFVSFIFLAVSFRYPTVVPLHFVDWSRIPDLLTLTFVIVPIACVLVFIVYRKHREEV